MVGAGAAGSVNQPESIVSHSYENAFSVWAEKFSDFLVSRVFPVGLFLLLTGLFWIVDHGRYSKVFYWAVLLPSILSIASSPHRVRQLASSRIFLACLAFSGYMMLSSLWSESEKSAFDLIKRPLFVLLLFYFVIELGRQRFDLLIAAVKWAAVFAIAAGVYMLAEFFRSGANGRFVGYGALNHALWVSHVFGFFLAWWLGVYFSRRPLFEPLALASILVLLVLQLATGSRTPLLAMTATILWLAAIVGNRKGALVTAALAIAAAAILLLAPEVFTQRGSSFRTEIWADTLRKISEAPWLGHGFDAPIRIWIEGVPVSFGEPHNFTLSVFFEGGLFGGLLWLVLYLTVLRESWRWRGNHWVAICSAIAVCGLVAGMTVGGTVLTRPREDWFVIWIPLALVAAAIQQAKTSGRTGQGTVGANG